MKKNILSAIALFSFVWFSANAQVSTSEYEVVKSMFDTEKRAYLAEFMELKDEEAKIFWPIYDDYETERAKFSRKRLEITNLYVEKYGNLSQEEATHVVSTALEIQKKELSLQSKYFKLMSKKLSPTRAARFIQIEQYLSTAIRMELQDQLPFVQEFLED